MNGIDLHTFGNNQVSQVAALKQIEIIEKDNILENVKDVGGYIRDSLLSMQEDRPEMGEIRALGFHIAIDLVKDHKTREPDYTGCSAMREKGFDNGIIFGVGGSGKGKNVLKIKPPLITTRKQADDILERYETTLKQVYG
jgi:4-aminobutyrate aminotransferase-like enzyme